VEATVVMHQGRTAAAWRNVAGFEQVDDERVGGEQCGRCARVVGHRQDERRRAGDTDATDDAVNPTGPPAPSQAVTMATPVGQALRLAALSLEPQPGFRSSRS
jgi:hypothetical protein